MPLEQQTIWEETERFESFDGSSYSNATVKQTNIPAIPVHNDSGGTSFSMHRSLSQSRVEQQTPSEKREGVMRRNSANFAQRTSHPVVPDNGGGMRRNSTNATTRFAQQTHKPVVPDNGGGWKSLMAKLGRKSTMAEQSKDDSVPSRTNQVQGDKWIHTESQRTHEGAREAMTQEGQEGNYQAQRTDTHSTPSAQVGALGLGGVRESMTKQGAVGNLSSQMKQVRREEFDDIGNDATSSVTTSGSSLVTDHDPQYQPMKPSRTSVTNRRRPSIVDSARHITRRASGESIVYKKAETHLSTAAVDLPPL